MFASFYVGMFSFLFDEYLEGVNVYWLIQLIYHSCTISHFHYELHLFHVLTNTCSLQAFKIQPFWQVSHCDFLFYYSKIHIT
jgi:hypothetical protein